MHGVRWGAMRCEGRMGKFVSDALPEPTQSTQECGYDEEYGNTLVNTYRRSWNKSSSRKHPSICCGEHLLETMQDSNHVCVCVCLRLVCVCTSVCFRRLRNFGCLRNFGGPGSWLCKTTEPHTRGDALGFAETSRSSVRWRILSCGRSTIRPRPWPGRHTKPCLPCVRCDAHLFPSLAG